MSIQFVQRLRRAALRACEYCLDGLSLMYSLLPRLPSRTPARGAGLGPRPAASGYFAGDPALWLQPEDHRAFAGDAAFGFGFLDRWRAARQLVTEPGGGGFDGGRETRLFLYSTPGFHEPDRAPHGIVEAENLVVDFARLYPARNVRFRPLYRTGPGRQYHRYRPGALLGSAGPAAAFARSCGWTGWGRERRGLRLDLFSWDHFRDIFSSYRHWEGTPRSAYDEIVEHPVVFATREGGEARNLFHSMTDLFNAFQAVLVARSSRDCEVTLLDRAPPSPFDEFWSRVIAPVHGARRVRDFEGRRILFRRAIFSPPGYQSPFYAGLWGENPVPHRVGLFDAFSSLVLRSYGIDPTRQPRASSGAPLRATLVARRPYPTREHLDRRLASEATCLAALRSAGLEAQAVDFARHSVEEQIRIAAETDILVGVHGAGLTHLLWLPPHGGVLELDDNSVGWQCFRHLATWSGRESAVIKVDYRQGTDGKLVTVDPSRLEAAARDLASRVQARRNAAWPGGATRR